MAIGIANAIGFKRGGFPWSYWETHLFDQDDLALWIKEDSRDGGELVDSINTDNNVKVLTPVYSLNTTQTISASDPTSFRVTTNSFIIEWMANVTTIPNYYVRCGDGSTGAPGYMVTPTQIRIASAAKLVAQQSHGLNYVGQGWVHCMIVINRAGYLDCYRNGIRTLHYDISADVAENFTNALPFYLASQTGVNGSVMDLAYYRMYKFAGAVPALDFAALALSNYQTGDINASLLPYCTHEYNLSGNNYFSNKVFRSYNTISDDGVNLVATKIPDAPVYSEYGSKYELDYGYSKYWYELNQEMARTETIFPLLRSGAKITQISTSKEEI